MHNEDMQEIRSYNKVVYGDQEIAKEVMKLPWCHRMDIIFVNFGLIENDCLIHKSRPAIVISTTEYNKQSPVMQVIPMSKQLKGLDKKYHVFVDHTDCEKLWESGMAMIEQMQTIDRAQISHPIGRVTDSRLIEKLETAVCYQLGMEALNDTGK